MSDFALLKNINDIDDDLVFEAENWKRPKARRIKIAVIAAAAAVIALLAFTGFEESYENDGKNKFEIHYEGKTVRSFYFNLKTWDITIPEEYKAYDKWGNLICFKRLTGTLPSELFEQFGVSPLMNDNFSEDLDYEWRYDTFGYDDNMELIIDESDYGYPILSMNDSCVEFQYRLLDKNCQKIISLTATYPISDEYNLGSSIGIDDETDYDIIKLKDGSKCCVYESGAKFSYDGVLYRLTTYDSDEDWDKLSLKLTKQILEDLGVY